MLTPVGKRKAVAHLMEIIRSARDGRTVRCAPLSSIRRIDCRSVDECLNQTLFGALGNARQTLEEWREDYNWAQTTFSIGQPDADGILEVKADGQNSHLRSQI